MIAAHVDPELRERLRALGVKLRRSQSDALRLAVEMVLCDGVNAAAARLNAFASGARKKPRKVKITADRFMDLLRQAAEETGYVIVPPEKSSKQPRRGKAKGRIGRV